MKALFSLLFFSFLLSCGDSESISPDISVGYLGRRAVIGQSELSSSEAQLVEEVCDSFESKIQELSNGDKFTYTSLVTENSCSSSVVNNTHEINLKLSYKGNSLFDYTDETSWKHINDKTHLKFRFESAEYKQGQMHFYEVCRQVNKGILDRVIEVSSTKRHTLFVQRESKDEIHLSMYEAHSSQDWLNSKSYSIKVNTTQTGSRGIIKEHEIVESCNPGERFYVSTKAILTKGPY